MILRLASFEREAKVLVSLNHPNIGHIYGLEEAEGQKALVLELVEGPTSDQGLPGGAGRERSRPFLGQPVVGCRSTRNGAGYTR